MDNVSINYQYHYTVLSDSQKALYDQLYRKISSNVDSIKLPLVHINEIWIAFEAMLLDNPWIFQTESYKYLKDLNKRKIILQPEYRFSGKDFKSHQATLLSSLNFFDTEKQKNDYDKVLYVHDSILHNVKYDDSSIGEAHTAVGIATNNTGVCEGIAKFTKLALDYLSVKSIIVVGRAINPAFEQYESEDHAWNMVEVDGKWYHLDVTFDLTITHKINRYDYFLIRDEEIRQSHSTGIKLPSTSSQIMDFYFTNGLIAKNIEELESLVYNAVAAGQRLIQFKLLNISNEEAPADEVLETIGAQCERLLNGYSLEMRYNDSLWIFEIEIQ